MSGAASCALPAARAGGVAGCSATRPRRRHAATRCPAPGGQPRAPSAPSPSSHARRTLSFTAPASIVPPPPPPLPPAQPLPRSPSPATTSAASASRASRVSRTATDRVSGGAPSSTTSSNAPLRSSTSAHQGARPGSVGRTTQSRSSSSPPPTTPPRPHPSASGAQSRGASVRPASTYATHPPPATVRDTSCRSSVVRPLPNRPTTSVSRPRGSPPPGSASSSGERPVGTPGAPARAPSTTSASWRRSSVSAAVDTTPSERRTH